MAIKTNSPKLQLMDGSKLTTKLLKMAYANGLFPMADAASGAISWYRPDPRAILPLDAFHCSRSLRRTLNKDLFQVTFDQAFRDVMAHCADREETWISDEFKEVYAALHEEGHAHSVEVWRAGELVGGTYGVTLGGAFFAESKFHTATDASKVAVYHLVERLKTQGFVLLEVQFLTPHLMTLGAVEIAGDRYMALLSQALALPRVF